MKKTIVLFFLIFTFSANAEDTFWNKFENAFAQDKHKEADFYLALHLNHEIKDFASEVPIIFQKLAEKGMVPTSFIDGSYSQEFFRFFFGDSLFQWNSNIFDENNLVILSRIGRDEATGLYAVVWGRPRMEMWSVIGEISNESFLLGYSDADIVVGQYNSNNQPVSCDSFNLEGPLSHMYKPSFVDIDKDGFPEMIIRFNATVADGFIQYLYVYKSENSQDFCRRNLIKEFSARNGFANYSNNIFITGEQKRKDGESWLGASLHELTEIYFDGKQEKIISKETKPNILRGNDTSYWY